MRSARRARDRRRAVYRRRRAACLLVFTAFVAGIIAMRAEDPAFLSTQGPEGASRLASTSRSWEPIPNALDDAQLAGASETALAEPLNVLILGVDKRPGSKVEGTGSRSDTIMLVQAVPGAAQIKLLSIPRDLLVEIEPGMEDKINAAYAYGGVQQAREVVESYTGLTVDNYVVIDFGGFRNIIDAMGGVEMDVEDEIPPKYGIKDGLQTLNGAQALFYARWRGTPEADLGRIERQQRLIAALRSEALKWDTVTKLPQIIKAINENVKSDMDVWEAISLGRVLVRDGSDAEFTSGRLEGTPKTLLDGNEVLVPDEAANEVVLRQFRDQR
jgi:polyisoprenyl-teichoic acid--peptidoglycan teichoic acid transferase